MWVKKGFSELVTSDLSLKDKKEPARGRHGVKKQ